MSCKYKQKKKLIYYLELLLRFGLAWHPETGRNWAFPTLRKSKGFGYYVNLKKDILQLLQKGGNVCIHMYAYFYLIYIEQHIKQHLEGQPHTDQTW
jgi:hypothetical protein